MLHTSQDTWTRIAGTNMLISKEMDDDELLTAGQFIIGKAQTFMFDSDRDRTHRITVEDDMPTMCGGSQSNMTARERTPVYGKPLATPNYLKEMAGGQIYMSPWGIQAYTLRATTRENLDLIIRCIWLALDNYSGDTSLIGTYVKTVPTTEQHPLTYAATLIMHVNEQEDYDDVCECDPDYGCECGPYNEYEDDDAEDNLYHTSCDVDLDNSRFEADLRDMERTAYLCEWVEAWNDGLIDGHEGNGASIMHMLAETLEEPFISGLMLTTNLGNPEYLTHVVMSSLINNTVYLKERGFVVVHNPEWASNPNERHHYVSSVYVCKTDSSYGDEQVFTSAPTVAPKQLTLDIQEAA